MDKERAEAVATAMLSEAVEDKVNLTLEEAEKVFIAAHKEILLEKFKKKPKTAIGNFFIKALNKEIDDLKKEMTLWPYGKDAIDKLKEVYKLRYLSKKELN